MFSCWSLAVIRNIVSGRVCTSAGEAFERARHGAILTSADETCFITRLIQAGVSMQATTSRGVCSRKHLQSGVSVDQRGIRRFRVAEVEAS
jgi:hypothetical protein